VVAVSPALAAMSIKVRDGLGFFISEGFFSGLKNFWPWPRPEQTMTSKNRLPIDLLRAMGIR